MSLPLIISFSGRKGSGKTTLCNICVDKYGYTLINFADQLKILICELFEISLEKLNKEKDIIDDKILTKHKKKFLSKKIGIDFFMLERKLPEKFNSFRNALQFIGSDIIRKYNPDWFVNIVRKQIENGKRYCFGDTRFKNEQKLIEEINGECWFIINPNNFQISNHESETSLKWKNFDNVIINNQKRSIFIKKWESYMYNMDNPVLKTPIFEVNSKKQLRIKLKTLMKTNSTIEISKKYKCSRDKIVYWCSRLMININRENLDYDNDAFYYPTKLSSYVGGLISSDGCVKIYGNLRTTLSLISTDIHIIEKFKELLKTNKKIYIRKPVINRKQAYEIDTNNFYILENVKHWDIEPCKSMKEKIPTIIRFNINMLKYWIVGLIDGDGSIFISNNTLHLVILSSESVIDYLKTIIPINSYKYLHKDYDNKLYDLKIYNHLALDFCHWLGEEAISYGLERKWGKISEFKLLKTKRRTTKSNF